MRAREAKLTSPVWRDSVDALQPVVWEDGSDSASLDNALESASSRAAAMRSTR